MSLIINKVSPRIPVFVLIVGWYRYFCIKRGGKPYVIKDNKLEWIKIQDIKWGGLKMESENDNNNDNNKKTWNRFIHFGLNLFYVKIK